MVFVCEGVMGWDGVLVSMKVGVMYEIIGNGGVVYF